MSVFEVGKTISESTGGHASAGGNSGAGNRFFFSDDAHVKVGLQRGNSYDVRIRLQGNTSAYIKLTMVGHRGYAPNAMGNSPFCYIVEALPQQMGTRAALSSTVQDIATKSFEEGIEAQHLMGLEAGDFYPTVSCFQYTDYTEITLRVMNQSNTLESSQNRSNVKDTTATDHSAALTKHYAGQSDVTVAGQAGDMGGDAIFFTAYIEGYSYNSTLSEGIFTSYNRMFGGRGVLLGSSNPNRATIDYISIGVLGNASDFGDLAESSSEGSTASNGSRGIHFGGYKDASAATDKIEHITFATPANALDFGELLAASYNFAATASDGSRGTYSGGSRPTVVNVIQYITIGIFGTALDFGDNLDVGRIFADHGGTSNGSRGMITGGIRGVSETETTMNYITIGALGNSIDFGELTGASISGSAFTDGSRACVTHGRPVSTYLNTIDYYNIGTTGNAFDFGDLSQARSRYGAVSDGSRGCFGGGSTPPSHATTDTIDYVTISTTGNMSEFGNMTAAGQYIAGTSGD